MTMIKNIFHLASVFSLTVVFSFMGFNNANGQIASINTKDSSSVSSQSFDLSEISKKTALLTLKAKGVVRKSIKKDELEQIKKYNDSLIVAYNELLNNEISTNNSDLSARNLENKLNYWRQNLEVVKKQETRLTDIFKDLEKNQSLLQKELKDWKNIDKSVTGEAMASVVHAKYNEVVRIIDTTLFVIDLKSSRILLLMDDISGLQADIELLIENLNQISRINKEGLFATNQPSIFKLGYTNPNRWVMSKSMLRYYRQELQNLVDYLGNYVGTIFFHLMLIIALILLLIKLSKLKIASGEDEGAVYKRRLKIILASPINSALIIGLFLSTVLYPNRPLILMDILTLFVTIPIILLLRNVVHGKYRFYAYVFGILSVLQVIFINLPLDNIISRLILFVIAILEITVLTYFILLHRKTKILILKGSQFFLYIIYALLTIAFIGFISNILGKTNLAAYMLEGVISFTLIIILVSLSAIVLDGLVVLLIDSDSANKFKALINSRQLIRKRVTGFINISSIVVVIYYVLKIFGLYYYVYDALFAFFANDRHIGTVEFTWGHIFIFFFVIWLSTVIGGIIRVVLEDDVFSNMSLKKGLPHTAALLIKYSIVTLGVILAVTAAGLPMDNLTVIIGAFSVGIGFGLQNIFNNLVSGLILLFERPIQIGDTIEVGQSKGTVRSIGIRSSNIKTFDGAEIIVPNGNLISNEVTNWTLSDERRRIEIIAGVSYNSDPNQVKEILMKVINSHPDIATEPPPNVLFNEMADSSLNFRMLFWTNNYNQWVQIKSEIVFGVFYALKEAGIEIPFPQRDLHLRSVDPKINSAIGIKKNDVK